MPPLSAKRIIRNGGSIKIRKCVDRKGRSREVGGKNQKTDRDKMEKNHKKEKS
jgi:hypothetical protein